MRHKLATRVLEILLAALGLSAIVIGLLNFFKGSDYFAYLFRKAVTLVLDSQGRTPDLSYSNVDNELRFYAAFLVAYGVVVLQTVYRLNVYWRRVPWLLLVLLFAGLGRAMSYTFNEYGPPHEIFVLLMLIQVSAPVAMLFLWELARPTWSDAPSASRGGESTG